MIGSRRAGAVALAVLALLTPMTLGAAAADVAAGSPVHPAAVVPFPESHADAHAHLHLGAGRPREHHAGASGRAGRAIVAGCDDARGPWLADAGTDPRGGREG
ncbi:hypothetical protein [Microbacterium xylanilyticum]